MQQIKAFLEGPNIRTSGDTLCILHFMHIVDTHDSDLITYLTNSDKVVFNYWVIICTSMACLLTLTQLNALHA